MGKVSNTIIQYRLTSIHITDVLSDAYGSHVVSKIVDDTQTLYAFRNRDNIGY